MILLVWTICTVIVILWVKLRLQQQYLGSYVKNLPKIPFKVLLPFLRPNQTTADLFKNIEKITNYHNGLAAFFAGPRLAVVCSDPENMKTVLMSKDCLNKPYLYRMVPQISNGLLFSSVHEWREDRKNIKTVFAMSTLKTFESKFNRRYSGLTKKLEAFANQPEVDLQIHLLSCNLNTFLDTNFGYDFEDMHGCNHEFLENIARLAEIASLRAVLPLLHPTFLYRFSSSYAEEKKRLKYLNNISRKIIANAREVRETDLSNRNDTTTEDDDTKPTTLIEKFIDLADKGLMDEQRVLDQVVTFMATGTDTTPFTVLNALLLLAMNQTVQDRVYEELRANIPENDYVDFDTLSKMEYFNRVVKETMRLLPLGFVILRQTTANLKLSQCTLPKGTIVLMNLLKMHRSEEVWGPTAMEFNPDRFLPEAVAQRHTFAFNPFATGPRNCIGNKYAMFAVRTMLCHLLLKYKFSTNVKMSDIGYKFDLTLKLNIRYLFKLEKRCAEQKL